MEFEAETFRNVSPHEYKNYATISKNVTQPTIKKYFNYFPSFRFNNYLIPSCQIKAREVEIVYQPSEKIGNLKFSTGTIMHYLWVFGNHTAWPVPC